MTGAASVTATFTLNTYQLTVAKTGTGSGTVTSTPSGIACGATCGAVFGYGAVATLTAVPSTGSTFAGWSGGGCSGTGTCAVTMTGAASVTATFTLNTYQLTVAKTGTGSGTVTSTPSGIACGATCSAIRYGDIVALTAVGSTFGWSGGGCSGTGTCTVPMAAATTVAATFTAAPGTLPVTVSKAGSGTGSVESSPAGIACGPTCSATYASGTQVTLTATPTADSTFGGWAGACSGTSTCFVTVDQVRSVTATFTLKPTTYTYYLAEGATGAFFDLDIIVANPNDQDAPVAMTFLDKSRQHVSAQLHPPGEAVAHRGR